MTNTDRVTFSLRTERGDYIELQGRKRYVLVYFIAGHKTRRRFRGATFVMYNLTQNRLVFITPKGSRITVPPEMVDICVEMP